MLRLTPAARAVLLGEETVVVGRPRIITKRAGDKSRALEELGPQDPVLFEAFRTLRRELAEERGVPPYEIFGDATLIDLCHRRPRTPEEFLSVNGVGAVKLERFGEAFLGVISDYAD